VTPLLLPFVSNVQPVTPDLTEVNVFEPIYSSPVMLLALTLIGVPSAPSLAHDWYPTACCSERDCRALVEGLGETVLDAAGRFELWDGRTVDRDKAQVSPDGRFHLCETRAGRILCFFAPPGAS
jgi:hypothetical protein